MSRVPAEGEGHDFFPEGLRTRDQFSSYYVRMDVPGRLGCGPFRRPSPGQLHVGVSVCACESFSPPTRAFSMPMMPQS